MTQKDQPKTVIFNQKNSAGNSRRKFPFGKIVFPVFLALTFFSCLAGGAAVRFVVQMYKTIPSPDELSRIQPSLVTRVYAADGSLIHDFAIERRVWVPLDSIPLNLRNALIAIEDRKFYEHHGIDLKRIIGAAFANVASVGISQGGSTITQQLARNVYLSHDQTITRKVREILTALKLESCYTKDEILELYFNMVYFGGGAYGVESASQSYFNKHVWQLNLQECAVIAGMIQRPEGYRPDRKKNLPAITERRNTVLASMYKIGAIKRDEMKAAQSCPIETHTCQVEGGRCAYFVEMVRQYLERKYGEDVLYNGGLSIYTTLDPVAQDTADWVAGHLLGPAQKRCDGIFLDMSLAYKKLGIKKSEYLDKFDSIYAAHKSDYTDFPDSVRLRTVQSSIVAMDPTTGAIKVMTGGKSFSESKFNRATQAMRQPGSAFKAFVYSAALENGFTPSTVIVDQPISLETQNGLWQPDNYEGKFNGPMSIRDALKMSINCVAIQTLLDIGADKVVEFARRAGLQGKIDAVPSIAIGSCEATNLEMTRAYSTYPGEGQMPEPYFIEKVLDKNGKVIEKAKPKSTHVCDPKVAYLMTSMFQTVVQHGTAASIPGLGFTRPAGGKTGTTNSYADAWFVGFTPQVCCGVWVGVDERRSMGIGSTGTYAAIPLWVPVMRVLHRNLPVKNFDVPSGITSVSMCKESHKIATSLCPVQYEDCFDVENMPKETCDVHVPQKRSVGGFFHNLFNGSSEKNEEKKQAEAEKKPATQPEPAGKKEKPPTTTKSGSTNNPPRSKQLTY